MCDNSCTVCVSTFNKTIKKEIKCNLCDYKCCRACIEKFITSKTDDYIKCMNCNKQWNEHFIIDNFSKATILRLIDHRKTILFEKEKAKIPFSQELFKYDLQMNELRKRVVSLHGEYNTNLTTKWEIQKEITINYIKLHDYENDKNIQNTIALLRNNKDELTETGKNIMKLATKLNTQIEKWNKNFEIDDTNKNVYEPELTVIYKCYEEGCHGFIMSNYKCGICSTEFCKHCLVRSSDNHKCNPDDVATHELILQTTKPCPKCAVPIHKINGCLQMWCPSCKTAFNYKTGMIDHGVIHNPHYNQWIRNLKLTDLQNTQNCNRMVDQQHLRTHVSVAFRNNGPISAKFRKINYIVINLTNMINNLPPIEIDDIKNNLDLRIRWMNNTLDEAKFKDYLYDREKEQKFNNEVRGIYSTAVLVFNDLQHKVFNEHDVHADSLKSLLHEFDEVSIEFKSVLKDLHKKFKKKFNLRFLDL
jgi:hypothetical protein